VLEEGATQLSSRTEPNRGKGAPLPPRWIRIPWERARWLIERERWWRGERWRHEEREKVEGRRRRGGEQETREREGGGREEKRGREWAAGRCEWKPRVSG
jgi:hypothetical protein